MFAVMRRRVAVATALGCAATLLVSCSGVESSSDKDGNAAASSSTAPVSVDPAAPNESAPITSSAQTTTDQ